MSLILGTQMTTSLIVESDRKHTLDNKPVEEKREQMAMRRRRRRRRRMDEQASEQVTPLSPALVLFGSPLPPASIPACTKLIWLM
ncbi:hypothetical protein AMELA_G00006820 [Ameiurus melas]|uniref:Uncharacterized protein n=1 Tax=Ameiurus melas TaxID=219545 RepID=A0A7J6BFL9_AMEME|nr:hypothetical protein AMELA_G00006820 [Ameiurus melas]